MLRLGLPAPIDLDALVVLGALEAHALKVLFERAIGLSVSQDGKVDDDIDISGAGMCRNVRRTRRYQVAWS